MVCGLIAGIICRKPIIIKEEWVDPNISMLQSLFERLLSCFATKAIAISKYAKKFLIEKKGMKKDKIVLIPNGIPIDEFRAATKTDGKCRRKEFGISDDATVKIGRAHV